MEKQQEIIAHMGGAFGKRDWLYWFHILIYHNQFAEGKTAILWIAALEQMTEEVVLNHFEVNHVALRKQ